MSVTAARPVSERIAAELYSRLRLLTAGYSDHLLISEVVRPTRNGNWTPKHLQIVLTQSSPERNEESDCPGNPPADAFDTTFNIRCHVMPSERDPTPVDEYINAMAAEVQRVVCDESMLEDESEWHTFGELSFNATWLTHENIDSDGSFDGVNIPLMVSYRVSENNPFEVRA